jgi:hypothetical protein
MLLKVGVAMMALALAFPAAVAFAAFLFAEPMEGPPQMFTDVHRGWRQVGVNRRRSPVVPVLIAAVRAVTSNSSTEPVEVRY